MTHTQGHTHKNLISPASPPLPPPGLPLPASPPPSPSAPHPSPPLPFPPPPHAAELFLLPTHLTLPPPTPAPDPPCARSRPPGLLRRGCAGGPRPATAPRRAHPEKMLSLTLIGLGGGGAGEGASEGAPPGYLLFFICFPPGEGVRETGEKRKGKEAGRGRVSRWPPAVQERGGRRGEGRRSLTPRSLFFFFLGKGGSLSCKPMTQPHMGRPRPRCDTPHYKSALSGLVAPRKCTRARQAKEGSPAGTPGLALPGGPETRWGLGAGASHAGFGEGVRPPAALLPPPPLPRGPRGRPRGDSSARGPWRGRPRAALAPSPRRRPALPGPAAPTSSRALRRPLRLPQARGVRRGPATGALALLPNLDPDACPRLARGRRMAVGAVEARCWNCSGCVPYEKQNIFTLKKKMFLPVAWISPGLF